MTSADSLFAGLDLSASERMDLVLAILSMMEEQKDGGWSLEDLAELAEVTPAAFRHRVNDALAGLESKLPAELADLFHTKF